MRSLQLIGKFILAFRSSNESFSFKYRAYSWRYTSRCGSIPNHWSRHQCKGEVAAVGASVLHRREVAIAKTPISCCVWVCVHEDVKCRSLHVWLLCEFWSSKSFFSFIFHIASATSWKFTNTAPQWSVSANGVWKTVKCNSLHTHSGRCIWLVQPLPSRLHILDAFPNPLPSIHLSWASLSLPATTRFSKRLVGFCMQISWSLSRIDPPLAYLIIPIEKISSDRLLQTLHLKAIVLTNILTQRHAIFTQHTFTLPFIPLMTKVSFTILPSGTSTLQCLHSRIAQDMESVKCISKSANMVTSVFQVSSTVREE